MLRLALKKIRSITKQSTHGFTMIELLVVIAVIGILAVALLATLNPLEQIRKGRDTRTRSDVAQLGSAIERFNASLGYFPWQATESEDLVPGSADIPFVAINSGFSIPGCTLTVCTIDGILANLTDTSEVKSGFIDRVVDVKYNDISLYFNDESTGASAIGCFDPESTTFSREAFDRCVNNSFGSDFLVVYGPGGDVCPDGDASSYAGAIFDPADADEMICLP